MVQRIGILEMGRQKCYINWGWILGIDTCHLLGQAGDVFMLEERRWRWRFFVSSLLRIEYAYIPPGFNRDLCLFL